MGTFNNMKNLSNPIEIRKLTAIFGQFLPGTSV
jgi:hypothetical protein